MGPGDLVVCINKGFIAGSQNNKRELSKLNVGDVYTISKIRVVQRDGHLSVMLWEVENRSTGWWNAGRFRPCRKTDIGSLEALAKEREHEVVE
jgi:hypothetical protein